MDTRYSHLYTVPPCLSVVEGCAFCPTVLGETADRGGRIDDAASPLASMAGETKHAEQLLIMDVCSFSFLGRSDMPHTCKRKMNASYLSFELFLHLLFMLMSLVLS
jgi:hypothetical protein